MVGNSVLFSTHLCDLGFSWEDFVTSKRMGGFSQFYELIQASIMRIELTRRNGHD